ncbi:hypothetical protein [Legionella yabuuchiae]|uniref:hypothetical protein n=1 Tax=Legionella yabuuchiae TaxID=376727 RepID=UPI001055B57A|nr:hypothetical protein [Legionella yabuuchiae]
MDRERYNENKALFTMGIIFLLLAMILIGFSIYVLPHLIFGWVYDVPGSLFIWREHLERSYNIGEYFAAVIVFLAFFIPGLLAALLACLVSNRIDRQYYSEARDQSELDKRMVLRRDLRRTRSILAKIVIILILVIIAVEIIEWLLYIPPIPPR